MKYENQSLCSACGGYCCKQSPCFFMPEDFPDLSLEGLLKEFREKDYLCIILDEVAYISMRTEHWKSVVRLFEKRVSGPCVLLTPTGCKFSYDERPTGGKLLIPDYGRCYLKLDAKSFIKAWKPYSEVLHQLMAHL
ncbi:MAG: hypothetical protein HFJ57_03505 [Clostridia bacterium]|nr:hypothetical protein [Clostridia bacterium]